MTGIGLRLVAFVLLVTAAIAGGHAFIKRVETRGYERGAAAVQQRWDAEKTQRAARALEDINLARAEEARRDLEKEKVIREAETRTKQAVADAAAARNAAAGLRKQLDAYVLAARATSLTPKDSSAGPAGAPTVDAIAVLADVFAAADARAGILAKAADAARTAGLACERQYQALTP